MQSSGKQNLSEDPGAPYIGPWWMRYGLAIAGVALAWALRASLTPLWGETATPVLFFYPVIALTAWFCRLRPALVAVVLATLVADWFFIRPIHSLAVQHPADLLALFVFAGGCFVLTGAIEAMHRANARARREVVERKRAEAALREAQEQLARANEDLEKKVRERTAHLNETIHSLERICYNIAHDLRAPIRSMQGFSQLLLSEYAGSLDVTAQEYLRRIAAAAMRNDALILDLLAYGRLGHVELPCANYSLRNEIESVLKKLSDDVKISGAAVQIQEPLPDVRANRIALEQALTNLFSNALKFVSEDVKPRITIWAEEQESRVRVCVRDNGIGIAREHQARIFEIFERLHSNESYPGTGIGLAIVQKSVERMGGRVGVDSEPGKGSRFWFDLPKAQVANQAA
jgi:signal transduction histidine kinase